MKFLVLILTVVLSSNLYAAPDIEEFPTKGMTGLLVDISKGNVRIVVTKDDKARVKTEKQAFNKNCSSEVRRDDNKLIVSVNDGNNFFSGAECDYDIEIQVPKKTNVQLRTGRGDVSIIGTEGDIDFRTGKGNAVIDAKVSTLVGKTALGNVRASGVSGSIDLKSGNGDIEVTYHSVPNKGTAFVKTASGDVTLWMPSDSEIRASMKTATGSKINEVGEKEKAAYKVSLKSGTGDLEIRELKKASQ